MNSRRPPRRRDPVATFWWANTLPPRAGSALAQFPSHVPRYANLRQSTFPSLRRGHMRLGSWRTSAIPNV